MVLINKKTMTPEVTTYIYLRASDGTCVHVNACGPIIGIEYEHDDIKWMPSKDWPYKVFDLRYLIEK